MAHVDGKISPEKFTEKLRFATFRTLHDLTQDTNISLLFLLTLWGLDFIAQLLLPLGPSEALPWTTSAAMHGLWSFTQYLWFIPGAGEHFPDVPYGWAGLYAALAAWMCAAIGSFCWLTYVNLGYSDYYPRWMLVALRISARVAIHGLWGTIIMNLVDPFVCETEPGSTWRATGLTCWTGGHAGLIAFSAVLVPCVVFYHIMVALTYLNREPDYNGKHNLLAAPHGRVDAAILLLKTVMALFYVFGEENVSPLGFLLPVAFSGLAWLYLYLRFQPYHSTLLNGTQVAAASLYTFACACGLLSVGISSQHPAAGQAGAIAFFFCSPAIIFSGWALNNYWSKKYASTTRYKDGAVLDLNSPFAVELRARAIIAEAVRGGVDPRVDAVSKIGEDYFASTAYHKESSASSSIIIKQVATVDRKHLAEDLRRLHIADVAAEAKEVRDDVSELWQSAAATFGNNALLHIFVANFHSTVTKSQYLERLSLRQAVDKADWSAVDVHFFAWSRTQSLSEQAEAAGVSKMNVQRRMRYEKLLVESRQAVSAVRDLILNFWTELTGRHPDLMKLQYTGQKINAGLASTDKIFKQLLEIAPQNASLLRSYAEYLFDVGNDPRKAQELLADAEQFEDDVAKASAALRKREHAFGVSIQDSDLSSESVGTMRVSSSPDSLGTIMECSPVACRLVGYSQRDLVGRPLSDIIPQPIGQAHDAIVSRFLQVGETRFLGCLA